MFHLNCLKREPALSMEASARLNMLDHGAKAKTLFSQLDLVPCLNPGQAETLFALEGAGLIETVCCSFELTEAIGSEQLRIIITADGAGAPQVDAYVHDFFMSGWEGKQVLGTYAGKTISPDGRQTVLYRHIAIPCREGLRIQVKNVSGTKVENLRLTTYFQKYERPIDFGMGASLHSVEKCGRARNWGEKYTLLDVTGSGMLHSIQMSMRNELTKGQFMEGNFEIYLDDNDFPEYQSTGTEEFFMGGVYFTNLHTSAYSGCTRTFNDGGENPKNVISAHRYFLEDPITFRRRLRIVWSHGQVGQGSVCGPTEFDFSAMLYRTAQMLSGAAAVCARQAQARIAALDQSAANRPLNSVYSGQQEISEDIPLLSLEGAGTLETLAFDFDVPPSENVWIRFELDGHKQDDIPFFLFMMCDGQAPLSVSEHGGCTGDTHYYRLMKMDYRSSLKVFLRKDAPLCVSVYSEFRQGQPECFEKTKIRYLEFSKNAPHSIPVSEGPGYVDAVCVKQEGMLSSTTLEFWDAQHRPLMVEQMAPFFFCPKDRGGMKSVSASVGVMSTRTGDTVAYRVFPDNSFRFGNGLELRIAKNAQSLTKAVLFLREEGEEQFEQAPLSSLMQRLNRLDFAPDEYEGRCYNPLETGHYYPIQMQPGETRTMLEDFGPGLLQCIRFGTPSKGAALHEAMMRIYLNGETNPAVETTCARFFSADYADPLFWANTRSLTRPSKRGWDNAKNQGQHTSFLRYFHLPYQAGIRFELTAPEDGIIDGFDNVYYAAARGTGADFGCMNHTKDIATDAVILPGERKLLFEHAGDGVLTSLQLMVTSEEAASRHSVLEIVSGGGGCIRVPLHRFFMGSIREDVCVADGYLPVWRQVLLEQDGYFSAPNVGWIKKSRKAPYRDVMYRLMEKRPFVFENGIAVYLTNAASSEMKVESDTVLRQGKSR